MHMQYNTAQTTEQVQSTSCIITCVKSSLCMHGHAFLCFYPQLLLMQTKNEEKQPHWVVSREEVEVTDELLNW